MDPRVDAGVKEDCSVHVPARERGCEHLLSGRRGVQPDAGRVGFEMSDQGRQ